MKAADEHLERLEVLEHDAAQTIRMLRSRGEASLEPLLKQMALDTMLHSHQLRRARERIARGSSLEVPAPPSSTHELPEGPADECVLGLAQRGVNTYRAVLDELIAPAALRGMLMSCLADEREHLRIITQRLGIPAPATPR